MPGQAFTELTVGEIADRLGSRTRALAARRWLFGARPVRGAPRADGAETIDARFFSRDELATLPLKNSTRLFLERGATAGASAYFEPPKWQPK